LTISPTAGADSAYRLTGNGQPQVGVGYTVNVTLVDQYQNESSTAGTHSMTFNGTLTAGTDGSAATLNGVAQGTAANVTLTAGAGSVTLVAHHTDSSKVISVTDNTSSLTSGGTGGTTLTVSPTAGADSAYRLTGSGQPQVGVGYTVNVTLVDQYQNQSSTAGTHSMTFNSTLTAGTDGSAATLNGVAQGTAANVTLTAGAGSVTLVAHHTDSSKVISVTDNTSSLTSGGTGGTTLTVSPTAGADSAYRITAASTTPAPGTSDQLTITLVDQYQNQSGYSADKTLTFSGIATNSDDGTAQTITSKTGSAVNIGTAEAITFASGISSSANGAAVLTAYKAQTNVTLNVSDGTLSSTSTGGAGVSLTITNVNPVVTNTYTATRQPNISLKIPISTLMTNATDANHDNISFSGVDTPTGQGATIYTNATWVLYLPANNNNDTITYSVSDGHGGTGAGTIYVNVIGNQPGGASGAIAVSGGVASVKMFGIPGSQYDVQRSTNLTTWTTLTSAPPLNAAPPFTASTSDGSFSFTDNFSDLGGAPSSAYYRTMGH
jgi:hypothetical protein